MVWLVLTFIHQSIWSFAEFLEQFGEEAMRRGASPRAGEACVHCTEGFAGQAIVPGQAMVRCLDCWDSGDWDGAVTCVQCAISCHFLAPLHRVEVSFG
jgi:hypothetical protein